MKKKPSERIKNLWSLKLYKNDIEELLLLLNDCGFVIQLSDKKYEYASLDEIQTTQGDVIRDLTILGTGNGSCRVQLRFSRPTSTLEVSNHDEAFLKIEDLLRPRKRILFTLIFGAVAIPSVLGFAFAMTSNRPLFAIVSFVLCMITGLLFMGAFGGALSVVYLTHKHQRSSFWRRNKDEILRQLISNILSFGLGLLAAYLLFKQGVK